MKEKADLVEGPKDIKEVLKNERVMVVDDEEVITSIISTFLMGQKLSIFVDPIEALNQYRNMVEKKEPYTLVITDIFMPKMDGLTLIREIKEIEKTKNVHTSIVAMSGFGDKGKEKSAMELGIAGFLDKPFLKETFFNCLYQAIKKR